MLPGVAAQPATRSWFPGLLEESCSRQGTSFPRRRERQDEGGLGIGGGDPLYVIRIDAPRRQVIVGPRDALQKTTLALRELNWLAAPLYQGDKVRVQVKVRSTRPPVPATLEKLAGDRARVCLDVAEEGVAPGQACVAYAADDGNRVLGGGWIVAGEPAAY